MATHSSILAWRIPWTEEPGGLQSVRSESQARRKQLSKHTSMGCSLPCNPSIPKPIAANSATVRTSILLTWFSSYTVDFPGGAVDKNLACNARATVSVPGLGRFHTPQGNKAQAPQLLCLFALEPVLCKEKHGMRIQLTAIKTSTRSPLEKARVAAKTQYSQK